MIQIIHNPRCSKSRDGLSYLETHQIEHEIIAYLDQPLNKQELISILEKLSISPIELVRKNEAIWKENFKNQEMTDDQIIDAMVEHPKLIERPIFIHGNKAVIGRPTENIEKIL